eukprot:Skav221513  [mRNA]  locus=scaffold5053:53540:55329:+ [translate_table: standard]
MLVFVKLLARLNVALEVRPLGCATFGKLVAVQVKVRFMNWSLPQLNVDCPHHISLCLGESLAQAVMLKDRMTKVCPISPRDRGTASKPTARELSVCRTARLVEGLEDLQSSLKEIVLGAGLAFPAQGISMCRYEIPSRAIVRGNDPGKWQVVRMKRYIIRSAKRGNTGGLMSDPAPVALLLRPPWAQLVVAGEKVWELRSTAVHRRGRIAIAESGSGILLGEVTIVDCVRVGRRSGSQLALRFCLWIGVLKNKVHEEGELHAASDGGDETLLDQTAVCTGRFGPTHIR